MNLSSIHFLDRESSFLNLIGIFPFPEPGAQRAFFFKRGDEGVDLKVKRVEESEVGEREEPEKGLFCIYCGNFITSERERVEINGRHIHIFINPHRIRYEIGCFRRAPGCRPEGPFESVWTWFPGYSWQIQRCADCGHHLGWKYRRGEHSFFGLVLEYLTEEGER